MLLRIFLVIKYFLQAYTVFSRRLLILYWKFLGYSFCHSSVKISYICIKIYKVPALRSGSTSYWQTDGQTDVSTCKIETRGTLEGNTHSASLSYTLTADTYLSSSPVVLSVYPLFSLPVYTRALGIVHPRTSSETRTKYIHTQFSCQKRIISVLLL